MVSEGMAGTSRLFYGGNNRENELSVGVQSSSNNPVVTASLVLFSCSPSRV